MDEKEQKRIAESAMRKVIQARTNLVLDEPFFGLLALRLDTFPDWTCDTFWTDGKRMGFNPAYTEERSLAEVVGVICHEVLHVSNGHPWRRGGIDLREWNEDTDYAINPMVLASNKILPPGGLFDLRFDGLSAEQIHLARQNDRQQEQQNQPQSSQDNSDQDQNGQSDQDQNDDEADRPGGQDTPGGCGEVRDCKEEDAPALQEEWKVAVLQAYQAAKAQGKVPGGIERLVGEIRRPKVDWRVALRRFVQNCAKQDYSWRLPNKRYLAQGLYLPTVRSEQMPPMIYGWDMSRSRDSDEMRAESAAEVAAIFEEMKPERLYVPYFDTEVPHVDEFEPGDVVKFNPKGGGGTDFRCLFRWVAQKEIDPACLVVITDGYGTFPNEAPDYPVLWAMTTDKVPPFGEVIRLDQE